MMRGRCMEPIAAPDVARYRRHWPARSFLARISPVAAGDCFAAGNFHRVDGEEILIEQGTEDQSVFLLVSGCVRVTAKLDGGGCALLAVRVGGDVVGEVAALDGGPRSATVQINGRQSAVACV